MRGISFHIDDDEEVRRDRIEMTNRDIFLLGVKTAEKKQAKEPAAEPEGAEDNISQEG